jgi:hypothetical protein
MRQRISPLIHRFPDIETIPTDRKPGRKRPTMEPGTSSSKLDEVFTLIGDLLLRLKDQERFPEILHRGRVQNAKNWFSLKGIHRYTTISVTKAASLNILFTGRVISLGFRENGRLQSLAEWRKVEEFKR